MTRRWRDNSSLVEQVKLFLIDEVHLLNDESRGATMEVRDIDCSPFCPITERPLR